jgi:hypothetical protein
VTPEDRLPIVAYAAGLSSEPCHAAV